MRIHAFLVIVFLLGDVDGRKKKWLKHPSIVVRKKSTGEIKEIPTEDFEEIQSPRHLGHHHKHRAHSSNIKAHGHRLNFDTDALPYSSPFSRPFQFNMYTDGPFGWGPARRKRFINSYNAFKRTPYAQNYINKPAQIASFYQPAQPAPYVQPEQQPYYYQAAQSRDTLSLASNPVQPLAKGLQRKAPQVQQPRERTWVDKMGVKWTTRKVNDYKWGEREPGITMDEYAGGPFGFDDVKRSLVQQTPESERRQDIPETGRPRSWINKSGVRWTNQKVNDYKWGEREPGVTMDEYNGGPYGWNQAERNPKYFPNRPRK